MSPLAFNKACEVEDFADAELRFALHDVYPERFRGGREDRDGWEAAMVVRALGHFGALRPDATLLGVPDDPGDVLAHVRPQVKAVYTAPLDGGRALPYPDEAFDGAYCSGLVGAGGVRQVAAVAHELGRVIKRGGVLAVAADLRLAGPPGGTGWPGRRVVLSAAELERFVVRASGLERVDDLRTDVSAETLATPRDLGFSTVAGSDWTDDAPRAHPRLVVVRDGYVFTSVSLVLRKTDAHRAAACAWARPPC